MTALAAAASRAVTDEQILDAYRFLAAREGVFCEPASAASRGRADAHGAGGAPRIACVLTGHGLEGPADRARRRRRGRAVRAGVARGRAAVLGR